MNGFAQKGNEIKSGGYGDWESKVSEGCNTVYTLTATGLKDVDYIEHQLVANSHSTLLLCCSKPRWLSTGCPPRK